MSSSGDILRKEAHELMDFVVRDPSNVLVSNKALYNERLAMCVDGDMAGYINSFKQQVKGLASAIQDGDTKYQDMKAQYESTTKQLEGITMVMEQTTKMLDAAEQQARSNRDMLEQATKQLEDERAKSARLEDMFMRIQKALSATA
jgi:chromosome segregation ATPase